jgi:hypothetical protein
MWKVDLQWQNLLYCDVVVHQCGLMHSGPIIRNLILSTSRLLGFTVSQSGLALGARVFTSSAQPASGTSRPSSNERSASAADQTRKNDQQGLHSRKCSSGWLELRSYVPQAQACDDRATYSTEVGIMHYSLPNFPVLAFFSSLSYSNSSNLVSSKTQICLENYHR